MAYASQVTRGYGSDGTATLALMRGYSTSTGTTYSKVTRGFGIDGTTNNLLLRGFSVQGGLPFPAPTGKQYITVAGLPWPTGQYSVLQDAAPPAVNGDIIIADINSAPDIYTATVNADGTFLVAVGGDTARESFVCDLYRNATGLKDGVFTTWVNNHLAQQTTVQVPINIDTNIPMQPVNLNSYIIDIDGDTLTYTISAGSLPNGITLSGSVISGSTDQIGAFTPTFRATDFTGEYVDFQIISLIVTDDAGLQALLDPQSNKTGPQIVRKVYALPNILSYYVTGGYQYPGRGRWVDTGLNDSSLTKAATIYAALQIPAQPDWPLVHP